MIFTRYLELGSVQALAQDLDRSGVRSKSAISPLGASSAGARSGLTVTALAAGLPYSWAEQEQWISIRQ
jgi:hypothetical protein